jgi:4-hydroxy-2-oxoheptanedioate aldolase
MAKQTMKQRKVNYTLWLATANLAAVEAAKATGCHGITLDLEHGVFGRESVDALALLAHEAGLACYARVAEPTRIAMQQVLDSGADGVIIPHVDNLEHAREVTSYAKYPPMGDRSVSGGRTFGYGGVGKNFFAAQNRRVRCYPMVETTGALADVEAILKLKTVDGIFLGPFDLNMASGRGGVFGREDAANRKRVAQACMATGKDFGMNVYSRDDMRASRDIGLTFAALTDDVTALIAGVGDVVGDARKIIGR